MRSGNPALGSSTFEQFDTYESSSVMTAEGAALKTGILLILAATAAAFTWTQTAAGINGGAPASMGWFWGGMIGGLVFALVTIFKPDWSPITAPLYAIAEGLFLGALSAIINSMYPGIALQAVILTFGTLFTMLIVYRAGWIRATENFKLGVASATGAICLIYLVSWVLAMFRVGVPFIHEAGLIGIGFSLFVVVIAALNLVLDFDLIEEGANKGAPKYMEWYGAFALMVTLVWLYIEILRLLAKLRGRD